MLPRAYRPLASTVMVPKSRTHSSMSAELRIANRAALKPYPAKGAISNQFCSCVGHPTQPLSGAVRALEGAAGQSSLAGRPVASHGAASRGTSFPFPPIGVRFGSWLTISTQFSYRRPAALAPWPLFLDVFHSFGAPSFRPPCRAQSASDGCAAGCRIRRRRLIPKPLQLRRLRTSPPPRSLDNVLDVSIKMVRSPPLSKNIEHGAY